MAYDSARHVTVLHGGATSGADTGDTWEWNGAAWTNITDVGMTPRSGHSMAFDSGRGVMVAFGGVHGPSFLDSLWEYNGVAWTQTTPTTTPNARSGSCMAYDAARHHAVMFGGTTSSSVTDEVWELQASTSSPQFQQQPTPVTANPGETVSFQATVNGATAWQWRRDGVALSNDARISGANSPSLQISGVTSQDWGNYRLDASNGCGTTPSSPAALIPATHCGSADFNCDGDVGTDSDIESFFSCLAGSCPAAPCISDADFNGDGDVGTDSDIESFFRVLAGGPC
jgi:hypothetical protein